jgi:small subunit ribosomal protein S4
MSRYTRPKGKVNRALGMVVYESAGAVRSVERRNVAPGMHGYKRAKKSEYGQAMLEKKKIKHYYGLHERQLARFFALATKSPQNTGEVLLVLCERRLDNVVRRAGFATTRPQARQAVCHGHFRVNGRKVDVPSYLVEAGDVISVRPHAAAQKLYRERLATPPADVADWVCLEVNELRATVARLPGAEDVGLPVEVSRVIELLSR